MTPLDLTYYTDSPEGLEMRRAVRQFQRAIRDARQNIQIMSELYDQETDPARKEEMRAAIIETMRDVLTYIIEQLTMSMTSSAQPSE